MNINNFKNKINTAKESDIFSHLKKCNNFFIPPLNESVDISEYSLKIFNKAVLFECWEDDLLIGLVAAYFNDPQKKSAYITNVSVLKEYFGNGIASKLLENCVNYGIKNNFYQIILEVDKNNNSAINLYKKFNFKEIETNKDKISMKLNILLEK